MARGRKRKRSYTVIEISDDENPLVKELTCFQRGLKICLKMLPMFICLYGNLISVCITIFRADSSPQYLQWLRFLSILVLVYIFFVCLWKLVLYENSVPLTAEPPSNLKQKLSKCVQKISILTFTSWFPKSLKNTSYAVTWLLSIAGIAMFAQHNLQTAIDHGVFESALNMACSIIFNIYETEFDTAMFFALVAAVLLGVKFCLVYA